LPYQHRIGQGKGLGLYDVKSALDLLIDTSLGSSRWDFTLMLSYYHNEAA
jgi:hypothetical protein